MNTVYKILTTLTICLTLLMAKHKPSIGVDVEFDQGIYSYVENINVYTPSYTFWPGIMTVTQKYKQIDRLWRGNLYIGPLYFGYFKQTFSGTDDDGIIRYTLTKFYDGAKIGNTYKNVSFVSDGGIVDYQVGLKKNIGKGYSYVALVAMYRQYNLIIEDNLFSYSATTYQNSGYGAGLEIKIAPKPKKTKFGIYIPLYIGGVYYPKENLTKNTIAIYKESMNIQAYTNHGITINGGVGVILNPKIGLNAAIVFNNNINKFEYKSKDRAGRRLNDWCLYTYNYYVGLKIGMIADLRKIIGKN